MYLRRQNELLGFLSKKGETQTDDYRRLFVLLQSKSFEYSSQPVSQNFLVSSILTDRFQFGGNWLGKLAPFKFVVLKWN